MARHLQKHASPRRSRNGLTRLLLFDHAVGIVHRSERDPHVLGRRRGTERHKLDFCRRHVRRDGRKRLDLKTETRQEPVAARNYLGRG